MVGSKNLLNLFRSARYKHLHKKNDFKLYGLELILGKFGSGKTLTIVDRVYDYLDQYKQCRLISNVEFKKLKNDNYFYIDNEIEFINKMIEILSVDNDNGCIIVIDEVKGFMVRCCSDSDNIYRQAFFTILSQVRKLHCLILLTQQLYKNVPSVLRGFILQNGSICVCKRLLPSFTYYMYYDMSSVEEVSGIKLKGKFKSFNYLVHSPELYEAYDSHAIVSSIKGLLKE